MGFGAGIPSRRRNQNQPLIIAPRLVSVSAPGCDPGAETEVKARVWPGRRRNRSQNPGDPREPRDSQDPWDRRDPAGPAVCLDPGGRPGQPAGWPAGRPAARLASRVVLGLRLCRL